MFRYVLLGSFGGSGHVVVGVYDDFEMMLNHVDIHADLEDEEIEEHDLVEPERFEVARVTRINTIDRVENYHRKLWDNKTFPKWATKDGSRPVEWSELSEG